MWTCGSLRLTVVHRFQDTCLYNAEAGRCSITVPRPPGRGAVLQYPHNAGDVLDKSPFPSRLVRSLPRRPPSPRLPHHSVDAQNDSLHEDRRNLIDRPHPQGYILLKGLENSRCIVVRLSLSAKALPPLVASR